MRLIVTHTFVGGRIGLVLVRAAHVKCCRDHVYGVHMQLIAYGRRKRGPYNMSKHVLRQLQQVQHISSWSLDGENLTKGHVGYWLFDGHAALLKCREGLFCILDIPP